jgi:hypothetical protein
MLHSREVFGDVRRSSLVDGTCVLRNGGVATRRLSVRKLLDVMATSEHYLVSWRL